MRLRTQVASVQVKPTYKWSVTFESFRGVPGRETLVSRVESAALFDSEDLAWAAGNRALDTLAETEAFPNLCEPF